MRIGKSLRNSVWDSVYVSIHKSKNYSISDLNGKTVWELMIEQERFLIGIGITKLILGKL